MMGHEGRGRRQQPGQRRSQPLHAPALLVDQHEIAVAADGVAEVIDEAADLLARAAIPREQDQPRWLGFGQERALGWLQRFARQTGDESGWHR